MPTPPTVFLDYTVVGGPGSSNWRQTWGKLRFPLGNESLTVVSGGMNSAEYNVGFTAADGSLFRHDYGYYGSMDIPPSRFFYISDPIGFPPPRNGYFWLSAQTFNTYLGVGPWMDYDDLVQLDGESVTMSGGGFSMNTDVWTNPPASQTVAPDLGSLVSVGKLAAF